MLQEWADMIDAWVKGEKRTPTLCPDSMLLVTPDASLLVGALLI